MNLYDLNQLLKRSKFNNRPLEKSNLDKLTTVEQLDIQIGDTGILPINIEDAANLISESTIQVGTYYKISGVDTNLYGGTEIIVKGISANQFSSNGWGLFYNPKYENFPVWRSDGEYNTDDTIIYGGSAWRSINGTVGGTIDLFNLDENWEIINPLQTYCYNKKWDAIEYDFVNNFICSRYEVEANNFISIDQMTSSWFWCNVNPMKIFRWGHPYNPFTQKGVKDCRMINSYLNCLNFIDGYISGVELSNFSSIYDIQLKNSSSFEQVSLNNNSQMYSVELDNSSIYNLKIDNESQFIYYNATNSNLYNIIIDNDSSLLFNTLNDSSFNRIIVNNNSGFGWMTLTNSNATDINLMTESYTGDCNLTNSNLSVIDLNGGSIYNYTLNDSQLSFIYLKESTLNNYNLSSAQQSALDLSFSYLNGSLIAFGQQNNIFATQGLIKYQFEMYLDGTTNNGDVGPLSIPHRVIPYGYYIHEVTLDCDNLTGSVDSTINLGIEEDTQSGLNDTNGVYTIINNKITNNSISSFISLSGTKTTTDRLLVAEVKNNPISNGSIRFEIIVKRINTYYIND